MLRLRGCRQHNLKNFSLNLPKEKLIVITGVSGSGKSSLAFDTIYAEGQRRYLEFLTPEARSLIKQMPKPDLDLAEGLSPPLAIQQGRYALFPRGTVATYTDIYDFLTLLFVHIGEQHSPVTGKKLTRHTRQEIIELILREYPQGTRIQLLSPIKHPKETIQEAIQRLQQLGYIRLRIDEKEWTSEDFLPPLSEHSTLEVIIDRLEIKEGIRERLANSIETALDLSQGILKVQEGKSGSIRYFTEIYVCPESGISFPPLSPSDFNFNSYHGACPTCHGQGGKETINPEAFSLDPHDSLFEQIQTILEAFPKKTAETFATVWSRFLDSQGISEETPVSKVSSSILDKVLNGSLDIFDVSFGEEEKQKISTHWKGLFPLIHEGLTLKKTKNGLLELPFIKWQTCPTCKGNRLKPESLACTIQGFHISAFCTFTVSMALEEVNQWTFGGKNKLVTEVILPQIKTRLQFLEEVGLGYIELNRPGYTLSDGEIQRIQLASRIGAKLSGILYILDEPSLGLHRQDIFHLSHVLNELKQLGNSIIIVEHESHLMSQADQLIELGPGAGVEGGNLIFQGSYDQILKDPHSLTGQWLAGRLKLPPPPKRKIKKEALHINHASLHNLKDFSVKIPLGCLVGLCGVSGSGKSTLANDLLGEEMTRLMSSSYPSKLLSGYDSIRRVILSKKQIERYSFRSIPATFVDIMTPLRQLFAETRLAKARGYTPSRFTLNKRGGRCEACEGQGEIRVSMEFMPDLYIPCEVCQGHRYNYETLQVTWENLNIANVLNLSAEEAFHYFQHHPTIGYKLELMKELGLEYLTLGQSFNSLSSGEIQRLRLVADLATRSLEKTLYILDEPSAGLHFQDVAKLVTILHRLIEQGHSVIVVEHHLDLLRQADWLIELGPGGGPDGGKLIFEGPPDKLKGKETPTGKVL